VILNPKHFPCIAASSYVQLSNPLEDKIQQASSWEAEVLEALTKLEKDGPHCRLTNGLPEWEK
jgi:hypothetical protein